MKTSENNTLVTFGKSIQRPEALETMPAANLMAMMQNGQWRKPIEAIRKEKNPKLQKEMKQRLPYFVYGVVEGVRSDQNVRQLNGIVFDFDHVGEDFVHAKQKLMDGAPWFRWLFRSPVDGLKLMIPFSRPVTDKAEYLRIWNLLKAEIEAKSGLKADNTPDLCRACFVSWDDDVITCPEEWMKDLDEYLNTPNPVPPCNGAAGVPPCNGAAGVPPAMLPALNGKEQSPGHTGRVTLPLCHTGRVTLPPPATPNPVPPCNGAAGVPPAMLPALNGKEQSPGHTGRVTLPLCHTGRVTLPPPPSRAGVTPINPSTPAVVDAPSSLDSSGVTPFHPSTLSRQTDTTGTNKTLADFPELLELFRRPQNIHLERDKLPGEIVDYLNLVGRVTDAQDGAKLTAFLPVVAANIGNRVYMYNAGTRHFCNIWAAIIGPSTVSRKTTVINQAMKMLQPFKESLEELSPKERNEQDIELSRVTQARLYNLLAINPNRLILQMELSAWMREMGKSYNAGMKQEITDMFDGKDRSIAKMEIDEHIARPAFSIVGATTEDWFFQELREVADQRGGFLQRFIICIIQNIDVNELRLESVDASDCDREIFAHHEMLQTFRDLPGSHRLHASEEARIFRDAIYKELMTAIAINANDPQAAYCARIFDNYFWRFCILIFLLKNWRDLGEAARGVRLASWFTNNQVDRRTAEQAWYLCDYYYRNTRPFLKQLTEGSKLDEERHLLKILQKAPGQELGHSRLLCKSRMPSRDFRKCVESLVERQAILCHERDSGYRNRVSLIYSLNPVLNDVDIS